MTLRERDAEIPDNGHGDITSTGWQPGDLIAEDRRALLAAGDELAFAMSFHRQTPTGKLRECDPECVGCAALDRWTEVTEK